jgi:imidazolonepropionase-like amidohydrolase
MAEAKITWVPTIDHNRYYIDAKDEFRFPAEAIPQLRSYIERNLDATRQAHRFGVKLAMGSDAVFTMFGQNTRELEWFIKAGLSPVEALYTATANAAAMLGQQDKLGKVAQGFYADIIAVEGEPWKDINAIFKVKWVMKNGAIVSSP